MNKAELVNVMAEKAGLTKVDAKKALDAFIGATVETLKKGEKVTLVGFGVFSKTVRKAHQARNPRIKDKKVMVNVPEKKVAKFKAAAGLLK
ncbi:MAG: HU family DNA-binding protein [Bacteroidales bacterium]|nr:HU family DNA-binding protein [Bacteroidales bacterium]